MSSKGSAVRDSKSEIEGVYPLMPSQYFDLIARRNVLDGEKRLMFAVLEDAIRTYVMNINSVSANGRKELEAVREWINSRGDQELFTFDNLCNVFSIDPDSLRTQLNQLSAADLPRRRIRSLGRRVPLSMG